MPDALPPNRRDPVTETTQAVERDTADQIANARLGRLSIYTCPECGGALWQVGTPVLVQFRCHVGHVLSGEDLLLEQAQAIEASLWRALRLLEDRRNLARQLAPEARGRGLDDLADRLEGVTRQAEQQRRDVQQMLDAGEFASTTDAGLEA